ncbi:MAG: hypothetical protein K6347_01775 [Campylobacterales bacterium]
MKRSWWYVTAAVATLLLGGCFGGSDSSAEPQRVSGYVIKGPLSHAKVCFDTNNDGSCSGEVVAYTNENGFYTLTKSSGNIVVESDANTIDQFDTDGNATFVGKMVVNPAIFAADNAYNVNIFSQIASAAYEQNNSTTDTTARRAAAIALAARVAGVSETNVTSLTSSNVTSEVERRSVALFNVVKRITTALKPESGSEQNATLLTTVTKAIVKAAENNASLTLGSVAETELNTTAVVQVVTETVKKIGDINSTIAREVNASALTEEIVNEAMTRSVAPMETLVAGLKIVPIFNSNSATPIDETLSSLSGFALDYNETDNTITIASGLGGSPFFAGWKLPYDAEAKMFGRASGLNAISIKMAYTFEGVSGRLLTYTDNNASTLHYFYLATRDEICAAGLTNEQLAVVSAMNAGGVSCP